MAKKKSKSKWNRKHEFQWKKETNSTKRHPAYIYADKRNKNKFLLFTRSSSTKGVDNDPLSVNINPNAPKGEKSYVRPYSFIDDKEHFEKSDIKFRIDKKDRGKINKYKK